MKTLYTLFSILILAQVVVRAQNAPEFSADVTRGCLPVSVSFTNLTQLAEGQTFLWDFGNGHTSTLTEPAELYTRAGEFTVSLTVFQGDNSLSITKSAYITVHALPEVDFSINSDTSACAPIVIGFENHITGDAPVVSYIWDFGEGAVSTVPLPQHLYETAGVFSVILNVTDANGCVGFSIKPDFLYLHKPIANFVADRTSSCVGALTANFSNLSEGETSLTSSWSLGDGTLSAYQNPTHTYETTGVFDVQLIVEDMFECSDTLLLPDYIRIEHLFADFQLPTDTLCAGDTVMFTNLSTDAERFMWDFGDGTTSFETNPQHSFEIAGLLNIGLLVWGQTCSDTIEKQIFIEKLYPNFDVSKDFSCSVPDSVYYTYTGTAAQIFDWRFGNGTTDSVANPMVYYDTGGTFSDTLFVISARGCRAKIVKDSTVTVNSPHAYFTPNIFVNTNLIEGCAPLTVDFINGSIYASTFDSIVNYQWTVNDVPVSAAENPQLKFTEIGLHNVTLNTQTAHGCTSFYTAQAAVGFPQNANFTLSHKDTICASEQVFFKDISTDSTLINKFLWKFGDSTTSTLQNPIHTYIDTGYMDIEFTVYYNGCGANMILDDYLYVRGPYIEPKTSILCDKPLNVHIEANAMDAHRIEWDFNQDGITDCTGEAGDFRYPEHGDYLASVTAYNDVSGCVFQKDIDVRIREIKAEFSQSADIACAGTQIEFNAAASDDEYFYTANGQSIRYQWLISGMAAPFLRTDSLCKFADAELLLANDINVHSAQWFFGDGSTVFGHSAHHVFGTDGYKYPIVLLQSDSAETCAKYFTDSIYIHKLEAYVPDTENGVEACQFETLRFTDSSVGASSWAWTISDSLIYAYQNPFHFFSETANYSATLYVGNEFGCRDTFTYQLDILPVPKISAMRDTFVCRGNSIQLSADGGVSYHWTSETETEESDLQHPEFAPEHSTLYYVESVGQNGCTGFAETYVAVGQQYAVALRDTVVGLGETVILNAETEHISEYFWSPEYAVTDSDSARTEIRVTEPIELTLTYTDEHKCFTQTEIVVIDILKLYTLDVPTAFTPNGDGINDLIFAKGFGIENLQSFDIFNRFGERVFSTTDIHIGWDGTYKNKPQPSDTYTYIVSANLMNGELKTKQGSFSLLR